MGTVKLTKSNATLFQIKLLCMNLTTYPQYAARNYSKRILLAVCGISPQIITETLYALSCKTEGGDQHIPTEIHVITTATGASRAKLALLSHKPGWFHQICREYKLADISFSEANIHVITNADGQALDDIRSVSDNEIAADFITEKVRYFTAYADAALHVSLAGGRKTMGFYLGYALSLYGRPQDKLSHVLVSEPYESCLEFFYPSKKSRIIKTRSGELADCQQAKVTLAYIPIVNLRAGLPDQLLSGKVSYVRSVAAAQEAFAAPSLVINLPKRTVLAGGILGKPSPIQLAILTVFARRVLNRQVPLTALSKTGKDKDWGEYLLRELRLMNLTEKVMQKHEDALSIGLEGDNFNTQKSKLERCLKKALGSKCIHYLVSGGNTRPRQYQLTLPHEAIEIISRNE